MTTTRRGRTGRSSRAPSRKSGLRIIPLGGLGEIGKNITAIEYGGDIIIIDCGLKFPEEEMLGIDFVIPDVQYLIENQDRIRGLFLTHGHEDHIGAIPLVLPRLDAPIYGSPLTMGLVENKMIDARTSYRPSYNNVQAGQIVQAGCFSVGFIRVAHSIPDSFAIYVRTPVGIILHSGDFKLDMTPIVSGDGTDLAALAELGREGVTFLLSDSTNSERPGFTPSESVVGRTFEDIFRSHKDRRIVIAAFASNLYRAAQVFATAARFNRKVVLVGRSMLSYVELAKRLGYLDAPDDLIITSPEADRLAPNRTVVLTTGSQGEPFSGLVLMSKGEHKQVRLGDKDLVVISATPIPGNEKLVSNTVNRLFACGCEVIYDRGSAIHASGHASREEQKILLSLTKPKYFIPVHGEYRHLMRHAQLAKEMGISAKNIFVMQNGDVLEFEGGRAAIGQKVSSGAILVDGLMLGEFEGSLLRERKELSESGIIAVSLVLDDEYRLLAEPQIDSRGSIYGLDSANMRPDVETAVERALDGARSGAVERASLPGEIRKRIRDVLSRNFRAYPGIIPLISFVDPAGERRAAPSPAKRGRRTRTPRSTKNAKDAKDAEN
jgi:ribonuclease J